MKYSQKIGIIAALSLMVICFMPWAFIASRNLTITGFSAEGTNFGKPGLFNLVISLVMLIMFAIPAIWAKRTNVFMAALNLAWTFRNFLLVSACMMGECPEKRWALYALIGLSILIQIMSLLPKLELPRN